MTTSELIRLLQAEDPEGSTEVVIGNVPIVGVATLPAYWDGCYQKIIREGQSGAIARVDVVSTGNKVAILDWPLEWILLDFPDLPVECPESYREKVERWRRESREIDREIREEQAAKSGGAAS